MSVSELYSMRKKVSKNSRSKGLLSTYVATERDPRSVCGTCSVPTSCKKGPWKLSIIIIFEGCARVVALVVMAVANFFAGTAFGYMIQFRNCIKSSLTILKSTRQYVISIASMMLTSCVRRTADKDFDAASLGRTGCMIG